VGYWGGESALIEMLLINHAVNQLWDICIHAWSSGCSHVHYASSLVPQQWNERHAR